MIDASIALLKCVIDYGLCIWAFSWFAKRKSDLPAAMKAYRELNTTVFSGVAAGTVVVSSSCSGVVDETLFQKVLFQAAVQSGRSVQIIGRHRLATDHPINIFHPETEYLKSLILRVV